jgi:MFS family permease
MLVGVGVASIFSIMVAVGKNYATLMLGRFLSGCFGVAPIAVLGAVTDNWSAIDRGVALSSAIGMVFSGPVIGPIVGNFICASYLGWRWTMWVVVIFGLSMTALFIFTLPETYPPQRLMKKSARLRKETGDPNIRCKFDNESMALEYITRVYFIRPWSMYSFP